MPKPSIKLVKTWDLEDETETYSIYSGTAVFDSDYYKVVTSNRKTKSFYGETAWSDAQRYAYDYESSVLYN